MLALALTQREPKSCSPRLTFVWGPSAMVMVFYALVDPVVHTASYTTAARLHALTCSSIGVALLFSGVHVRVCSGDELGQRVPIAEYGEADTDRWTRRRLQQRGADFLDPPPGGLEPGIRKPAEELVTADADDRVIGTQLSSERDDDRLQECVAGSVAVPVVELFEPVDINEREYERGTGATGAFDLVLEHHYPRIASVGAGQAIDLRLFQFGAGLAAVCAGLRAVRRRALAVTRGVCTVSRRTVSKQAACRQECSDRGVTRLLVDQHRLR
jgi:hypothetical protein